MSRVGKKLQCLERAFFFFPSPSLHVEWSVSPYNFYLITKVLPSIFPPQRNFSAVKWNDRLYKQNKTFNILVQIFTKTWVHNWLFPRSLFFFQFLFGFVLNPFSLSTVLSPLSFSTAFSWKTNGDRAGETMGKLSFSTIPLIHIKGTSKTTVFLQCSPR